MLCEKILGTLAGFPGKTVDYVAIDWYEAGKRLHRKTSEGGVDIAIRLDDEAGLPLEQDDVLGVDGDTVFAVDIPAFEVLVIRAARYAMAVKVAWETGNKHTPLFWGDTDGEFLAPRDGPLEKLLLKFPGVSVEKQIRKVDFTKAVSGGGGRAHEHHGSERHRH
jgi:urease accessory protein